MKYYIVSFRWFETAIFCTNLVKTDRPEDIENHYIDKGHSNIAIREATAYEIRNDRGMPVVTI